MPNEIITPLTLKFLKDLSKNNERDWFNAHKDQYLTAHENMCGVIDRLIFEMNKHDVLDQKSGKESLFRIYKDVRFSKDKSPYNPRFAFNFSRATELRRGGYYGHIAPGASFIACGFWAPNPKDLARIRQDIHMHPEDWRRILADRKIKANFGELQGDTVSTVPRGFAKDHPALDLLRHKQFFLRRDFSDAEVVGKDFVKSANAIYKSVRPFFDYMSEVLTTNADGESIVGEKGIGE